MLVTNSLSFCVVVRSAVCIEDFITPHAPAMSNLRQRLKTGDGNFFWFVQNHSLKTILPLKAMSNTLNKKIFKIMSYRHFFFNLSNEARVWITKQKIFNSRLPHISNQNVAQSEATPSSQVSSKHFEILKCIHGREEPTAWTIPTPC
jgi:hypothetical protein